MLDILHEGLPQTEHNKINLSNIFYYDEQMTS